MVDLPSKPESSIGDTHYESAIAPQSDTRYEDANVTKSDTRYENANVTESDTHYQDAIAAITKLIDQLDLSPRERTGLETEIT
ncbi:MAG: hypothetical protein AAF810_17410, partial [Cyanobacteria bacterium P01_D01_bin.36]